MALLRSLALPVLSLLAFALRVYRLEGQSLWYDEGFSAFLARLPWAQVLDHRGMDPHPPLHVLALGLWTTLAGASEVALRFPSVLAGTAAVLLTYRLGADMLGARVGTSAALLAAVNPFLIFYGQEARPYSFLLAFSLASTVVFLRLLWPRPIPRVRWLGYVAVTALALWSHYFAVFTLAGQWLVWGIHGLRRRLPVRSWLTAQSAVALAFLPWVALSLGVMTSYRAVGAPVPLADMARQTLTAFMAGPLVDPRPFVPSAAALGVLMAGGVLAGRLLQPKAERDLRLFALLVWAAAPLAGLALLSLMRPTFHPRYLIAAVPAVLVLAGAVPALAATWARLLGWALLGGMALTMAGWTAAYYHDSRLARDDYRSAAAFVAQRAGRDDALLYHAWYARFAFDYYFRGPQARYQPFGSGPIPEDLAVTELNRIAGGHPRVWVVLWQEDSPDPGRHVLAQLDRHATRIGEAWLGPLRVFGYRLPQGTVAPFVLEGVPRPMQASLGGLVDLVGYGLRQTLVAPGDPLRVVVYWRARQALSDDFVGFVHLIAFRPEPRVYGQQDHRAGGSYYPSSRWPVGETVRDEYVLRVPPETPPGEYILETGLYRAKDFVRLASAGDGASPGHDSIFLSQRITLRGP